MNNAQIRTRNWQKARLAGFGMNDIVMTDREREVYQQIMRLKFELLDMWDVNTEILIGHPLPPYKCNWCGRRSNVEYLFKDENFCYKHYQEHIND